MNRPAVLWVALGLGIFWSAVAEAQVQRIMRRPFPPGAPGSRSFSPQFNNMFNNQLSTTICRRSHHPQKPVGHGRQLEQWPQQLRHYQGRVPGPRKRRDRIDPLQAEQSGRPGVDRLELRGPFHPPPQQRGQGQEAAGRIHAASRRADRLQRGRGRITDRLSLAQLVAPAGHSSQRMPASTCCRCWNHSPGIPK